MKGNEFVVLRDEKIIVLPNGLELKFLYTEPSKDNKVNIKVSQAFSK